MFSGMGIFSKRISIKRERHSFRFGSVMRISIKSRNLPFLWGIRFKMDLVTGIPNSAFNALMSCVPKKEEEIC